MEDVSSVDQYDGHMDVDDEDNISELLDDRNDGDVSEDGRSVGHSRGDKKKKTKNGAFSEYAAADINERIARMNKDLLDNRDSFYEQFYEQFNREIKEIQEGKYSEFEERLHELIEIREESFQKAQLHYDYLMQCVKKMYDMEIRQAEEEYLQLEKQGLRDKMLADVEERRRKLKEDKDNYDIMHDVSGMEPTPRPHSQRKLRGTKAKDDSEPKTKRQKTSGPCPSTRATDIEINEDLIEMNRAPLSTGHKKMGNAHKKK